MPEKQDLVYESVLHLLTNFRRLELIFVDKNGGISRNCYLNDADQIAI